MYGECLSKPAWGTAIAGTRDTAASMPSERNAALREEEDSDAVDCFVSSVKSVVPALFPRKPPREEERKDDAVGGGEGADSLTGVGI